MFWTLLAPLSLALMYYLVFKVILKVDRPYYLFLVVSGVLCWNFFAQTVGEGLSHYVERQGLITKIYFPLQTLNLSTTITNGVNLLFALPIIFAVALYNGLPITHHLLLLPFYFLCLGIITYSGSIILAWSFVFLRDLRQLIAIFLQLMFYATPVLYTIDMVPPEYRDFFLYNPLATIIGGIQDCFLGKYDQLPIQMYIMISWTLGLGLLSGYLVIKKRTPVVENL